MEHKKSFDASSGTETEKDPEERYLEALEKLDSARDRLNDAQEERKIASKIFQKEWDKNTAKTLLDAAKKELAAAETYYQLVKQEVSATEALI